MLHYAIAELDHSQAELVPLAVKGNGPPKALGYT
jgi:hypothetical protein